MEWDPIFLIIVSKIFRKKTFWILPSYPLLMRKYNPDPLLAFSQYPDWLCYRLSDIIVVYSANMIKEWDLVKWRKKIVIAPNHFINFNQFKITKVYNDRENLVGYIGRFSEEKGIGNFLKAAKIILKTHPEIKIFLGGSGNLEKLEVDLDIFKEQDQLRRNGWIPHDKLPQYLNNIRLLIIPSYTEGLPNMMLEAMACGTPVLATPVGAIPDVIRDGETGFIMEDNSPKCIAENVLRALRSTELERIAENGRHFVEENFAFEKTVKQLRKILDDNTK
jgi:glycosyltransferase involved in cell wall biosynthesis